MLALIQNLYRFVIPIFCLIDLNNFLKVYLVYHCLIKYQLNLKKGFKIIYYLKYNVGITFYLSNIIL